MMDGVNLRLQIQSNVRHLYPDEPKFYDQALLEKNIMVLLENFLQKHRKI